MRDHPAVFLGVALAMALNHTICCADSITSAAVSLRDDSAGGYDEDTS